MEQVVMLPVGALFNHPRNRPFSVRNDEFKALVASIHIKGVLMPLVVRPLAVPEVEPTGYQILAGHRRCKAAAMAQLETVPCIVREMEDAEALEFVVFENLEREDPEPLDEAAGIAALVEMGWDIQAIASRCGRSPSWVMRRKALSNLIDPLRKLAADPDHLLHTRPITWLEELARLPADTQAQVQREIGGGDDVIGGMDLQYDLTTLTELRQWIQREFMSELGRVPWKLEDDSLYPQAGACSACPKRSSCSPMLFEDLAGDAKSGPKDQCLDQICYREKMRRHQSRVIAKKRDQFPSLVVAGSYNQQQDKDLTSLIGRKPVDRYQFEACKKSDPGAVPVIDLESNNGSSIRWMKPHRHASGAAKASSAKTITADGKSVTPLKERLAALERRRMAYVVNAIREHLGRLGEKKTPLPKCVHNLRSAAVLALVFGTANDGANSSAVSKHWKAIGKWDGRDELDLAGDLLRDVMPQFRELLTFHDTQGAEGIYKREVKPLCQLLDIDLPAIEAAATAEIPEPKAWAGLKADGTPKTAKTQKPEKAAAEKPAKSGSKPDKAAKKGSKRSAERYTESEATQVVGELHGCLPVSEEVKAASMGTKLLPNPEIIPIKVRRASKLKLDLCVAQRADGPWAASFRITNGSLSAGSLPTENHLEFATREKAILFAARAAADHHLGQKALLDLEAFEQEFTKDWVCNGCGCTNEEGCASGCHWEDMNCCSTCVEQLAGELEEAGGIETKRKGKAKKVVKGAAR